LVIKSKVDYRLIGLRVLAVLFIFFGLFVLLQSIVNFKDAQYAASEIIPKKLTAFIIDHGAGYMSNWVYSGKHSQSDEEFEKIYHCKKFDDEALDLLNELKPLKNIIISNTNTTGEVSSNKDKAITEALVCKNIIKYMNKGYRFFIADEGKIVFQDNDIIPRDMKSLKSVSDILKATPKNQIMTENDIKSTSSPLKIYVTIADYYYADYDLGFLMIFCAATGFVFCMLGVIMLERLAGKKISEGKARIRYFNKGFIEIILAVFLILSFNITAIIQYLWAEYQFTDFFESGKAVYVAYFGAALYTIVALWTLIKVGRGLNIAEQNANILKKMKADLITNVAHDIATPLTSIIGYVELLEQEDNLSSEARDYIEVLKNKSERLKNIVSDLFDLSKSTSDKNDLVTEKLDLVELINQTLAEMEDRIVKSALEIKKKLPDFSVYINADGNKIYRVFQNVIDNALKYSLSGTPISIVLNANSKKVSFEIQNTSSYEMNFTEEDILERFVRGDSSRTEEGTGLGLSIAETFTKAYGGDFKVIIDGDQFRVIVEFKRI